MNIRLNHIQKWKVLAEEANWSASKLAEKCNVSLRTLQRHFLKKMGKSPKAWLLGERYERALSMLRDGYSVKETASRIGYKQVSTFSQEFKCYWGILPKVTKGFLRQSPSLKIPLPDTVKCRVLICKLRCIRTL